MPFHELCVTTLKDTMDVKTITTNGSTTTSNTAYHHAPTVKPEAATAVDKLLMMGMRMPESC
jgi:hypothetical protein